MKKKSKIFLIVLVVILLVGGGVLYYSKTNEKRELKKEEQEVERKEKEAALEKERNDQIKKYQDEMAALNTELASLKAKSNQEFMAHGFSEEYYIIQNDISAKEDRVRELSSEIFKLKNKQIVVEDDQDDDKSSGLSTFTIVMLGLAGFMIVFVVGSIIFAIRSITRANNLSYSEYKDVDDSVLSEIDIKNAKVLKKELYERFLKVLMAFGEADYKSIKKLCSTNLAKNYIDEAELLKKYNQKNVIKDIENVESKIVKAQRNSQRLTVTLVLKIKLYDYVVDSSNKVVSGLDKKKQTQAFKLIFVKDNINTNGIKKCPNCGANIEDLTSTKCVYCGSILDDKNYDWHLVSKVVIDKD